ncbi:hypothetical protein ACJRO7_011338 [Eucalyptus globulus]|uniref:Thionin-like protein n=1 Tax=Eucalyptus globulus TaxID=34317 RepID=A0ABD3LJE9_EUCGL
MEMEIKALSKVLTLFLMLIILGVSSEGSRPAACDVPCILSCGKDGSPPLCYLGCRKKCGAVSPHPTPLDHCDLGCVTATCLNPDTDAQRAKACMDNCSEDCRKSYKPH